MSHELRTPLTLILNPLENASRQYNEDKNIEVATKNSRRLLRLVNQLLDFQKLKAGKRDLKMAPLDINILTHVCGDYFASACADKEVNFSVKRDGNHLNGESNPLMVIGEIDALEKIVFNYLSNALKHSSEQGRIEMGLITQQTSVRLYVTDTGAGISDDGQSKLFEVFSQVDDSTTRAYEGSGLGLALVKSLAEEMGAEVGVNSRLGEGSTFWVQFPLLSAENIERLIADGSFGEAHVMEQDFKVKSWLLEEVEGKAGHQGDDAEDQSLAGDGARILVVDDLADMRDLIALGLQKQNYAVLKASNGKQGLAAAKKHLPDLIVTDWMMPEMSGPELIKSLKDDPALSSIPVVLLTAKSDDESKLTGAEIGAEAFLGKPFNELELNSIVKNLIQLTETSKRELRHTKNLLAQADKMSQLGAMVATIGHEIANPLSLISLSCVNESSTLEKLEKNVVSFANSDDIEIQNTAQTSLKQINHLKDFSRNINTASNQLKELSYALRTQSRIEHKPTPAIDLNEVIKESILITGGQIKKHRAQDSLSELPKITCYRSKVGQVVTNLLSNAAEALSEKVVQRRQEGERFRSQIVITSQPIDRDGKKGVMVVVADNGDGVPEAIRENIFEQFFTTKEAGKGTGLGLSLCVEIVKEHGGDLSVTDDPELGGARFELWLPVEIAGGGVAPEVA